MPRAKGGPKTRHRRNKRLKLAKGQYGAKSRLFRSATESVDKGLTYAYVGARTEKVISDVSGSRVSARPSGHRE